MTTSTLQVLALSKEYRGRRVVDQVDLEVVQGEVVGLLGPNGAGKTTTFYMIVGLIAPDSGTVRLNGRDITGLPMYQRARTGISYLPQEPSVFRKLTVEENLLSISETLDLTADEQHSIVTTLLEEFGIEHSAARAHTLCPAARDAGSKSRGPWFSLLDLYCWMNRLRVSIRWRWSIFRGSSRS